MSKTNIKDKLQAIKSGWGNYVIKSEEIEQLALKRSEECSKCEHANPNGLVKKMMPDNTLTTIQGMVCDICTCPLSALTRQVFTKCPHDPPKWL